MKTHFCIHGVSSLIGKNFCRYLLARDYSITVFARNTSTVDFLENQPNVCIYRYENSISEIINNAPIIEGSVFVNLAWAGVFGTEKDDPTQITINIPQTISSIELSKKIGSKHWIGFGSQAEYANIESRIDETYNCNPVTLYGKSKLLCAAISEELCKTYGIEHSWLRLFSAYGPYGNHDWLVDHLIKEMKNDRVINVTKCEQSLDYIYVDDISELLVSLSRIKGVGIANLGSGRATKLKTIIETIHSITGSKSIINYGAVQYKENQGMFNEADITKISTLSGWKPKTTMEEGLLKMINQYNL